MRTGKSLRDAARDGLCDALEAVDPQAPTLCDGWTAYDLAVHVWQLSNDPRAWPAIGLPFLARFERRAIESVKRRRTYGTIVRELRDDPSSIGVMPADRLEGYRHAIGEYTVHAEDVRRANGLSTPPVPPDLADALWRRAITAGRVLRGRGRPDETIVLERVEDDRLVARGRIAAGPAGGPRRTVRGTALELLLWVHGREAAARVEETGSI